LMGEKLRKNKNVENLVTLVCWRFSVT